MTMTVGSLFSGIGGIDLGLERAGMRVVWQVENNPYAQSVLRKHWPSASLHGDVREVGSTNLQPVDLICGGFPCQDISVAGKGAGIEKGERSGLWREYVRIVRELRPRYVLVENVSALRSRGLNRVLGDLAALGYDAEWDCIPASAVGAPHQRDRIFVVAHAHGERELQQEGIVSDERGRLGDGRAANDSTDTTGPGLERGSEPETTRQTQRVFAGSGSPGRDDYWRAEPDVGRVADGVPNRVDRMKCLGNAVVPQVAEWVGRQILRAA